ncbi:hypothetical protein [Candidatus Uabimicrobium sp. HlEnr_7]|uniref:hypothetical protein n=1 Tax=Candidatus Uabimicrobium helgolandensis TaxID=3095367 RepID=UPI003557981D
MSVTKKSALIQFQRALQKTINQPEFKKLTIRLVSKDKSKNVPLFKWMEKKAASHVTTWPEWAALIAKNTTNNTNKSNLKRYEKQRPKPTQIIPGAFHLQHKKTIQLLTKDINTYLQKSIINSLQKFEQSPEYKKAVNNFNKTITLKNTQQLLPLKDILSPSKHLGQEIVEEILQRISSNLNDLKTLPYPYRKDDHLRWNLAIIMRVQSLLKTNYVDRLSRIVAAAESNFNRIFCKEIVENEVLPCIVRVITNPNLF